MALCQLLADLAMLVYIRFKLKFFQFDTIDLSVAHQLREFLQRAELRSEIKVMEKRILVVADINEGSVKPLDHFLDGSKVYIANTEFASSLVLVKFYKRLIF